MNRKNRALRVRYKIRSAANNRIRLSIFKSLKHVYVQAIDDNAQITLASASTNCKELKGQQKKQQVEIVGKSIAAKLLEKNIKDVVLDRGSYSYSGLISLLADAARASGLNF